MIAFQQNLDGKEVAYKACGYIVYKWKQIEKNTRKEHN